MGLPVRSVPAAVRRMFENEGTETFVSEMLGVGTWLRTAGPFTGFSTPVGVRGAFNRIKFFIYPFDSNLIPSTCLVRIRDTDYLGAILGQVSVPVGPVFNQPLEVTADFSATINSANPLWFELFTDGKTGNLSVGNPDTDYPLASYPQARYSIDANVTSPAATSQFVPTYPAVGALQGTQYVGFYLVGDPQVARLSDTFNQRLNEDSVLGRLFNFEYEFLNLGSSGPLLGCVWGSETAPFTGWGSEVGPQPDFEAVRFLIRAWDSAYPITRVRCRVRLTDSTGTILGDKTISVVAETGVATPVVFDFGATISGGATPLWLEFMTNGRTGQFIIQPIAYTSVNRRYWINGNVDTPGSSTEISGGALNQNLYAAFGTVTANVVGLTPKALLSDALNITAPSTAVTVFIHLPAILHAVEGIEFNIYWANIIRSTVGLDQLQLDVVCTKGAQWERFYRVTPVNADAGSYSFVLNVYYGGQLVATKSCTLVIKAKTVGGGATRKVLWIGDSTTVDGRPVAEAMRIDASASLDSNFSLSFQGTKTYNNSNADSTGATQSVKCEAISGWTLSLFYTDAASPFVFASVFDFAQYLSTNGITLAANDWVIICLGLNDIRNYTDDINLNDKISTMITQLDAMIVSIKAAVSGVRIALFLTIPAGDQNTFGQDTGVGQTAWRFDRNRGIWVETMLTHYDGRTAEKIYVFPYNAILDVPYNCVVELYSGQATVITQNAYRPELTFQVSYNGVHPADYGYWQMGAAAFSFLKAQES